MEEHRYTLLIVDDTETNIRLLEKMLEESYRIRSALSGEEALRNIETIRPDLVLLDVMMPDMDGYEVCRRLKERPETRQIPVIFVTSVDDTEGETKGLDLGAVDYITKPFNLSIARARIQTHLEMRQLYEERLLYKQKLFEEQRYHSLNELMVNISHHWRQPLSMISLGADSMLMDLKEDGCGSEETSATLDRIKEAAQGLSSTIDLFQRYQPAKRSDNESFFPHKLINDITLMHRDKLQRANLAVHNRVSREVVLQGDSSIFLNIILSLIENSADIAIERQLKAPQVTLDSTVIRYD